MSSPSWQASRRSRRCRIRLLTHQDHRAIVVLPTFNERRNLPVVVEMLLAVPGLHIMVVDDGSPDGTGGLADALARAHEGRVSVVHRRGVRGLGLSYVEGLARALRSHDEPFICQMDADLSHDPSDVPRLVAAAAGGADVVIGSRYIDGGRIENWPLRRLLLSAFANRYVRLITGLSARDCTSGFRCWRRAALERIPFESIASNDYAFLVELLWEAQAAGCRVSEVPITFVERRAGVSKLSTRALLESAVVPWRLARRGR